MRRAGAALAGVLVTVMTLTACAQSIPGTPVAAGSSSAERLDPGNYPTTLRTVEDAATPADAWLQEGWRMADGASAPWDVDPAFAYELSQDTLSVPVVAPAQIRDFNHLPTFSAEQVAALVRTPFAVGFLAVGATESRLEHLTVGILRFPGSEIATQAFGLLAQPRPAPPGVAGVGSLGVERVGDQWRARLATQRGDLLLVAEVGAADETRATALAAKALAHQDRTYTHYLPTPLASPMTVPADRESIMRFTLPNGDIGLASRYGLSPTTSFEDGYRSAYADALALPTPDYRTVLELYDVDLVANTFLGTTVYRTRAAEAARAMHRGWYRPGTALPVPGLGKDRALCQRLSNGQYQCTVAVDRYLGKTIKTTLVQAQQAITAQYLILRAGT